MVQNDDAALQRELNYHEKLYAGFAQSHFAKPAVRALRQHMVSHTVSLLGLDRSSVVVSLGCGIGDTELLLARHVGRVIGVDLSPSGISQARADAQQAGIGNAEFFVGTLQEVPNLPRADAMIAIWFLHHLTDQALAELPSQIKAILKPGGLFYSLDPSRDRLSGKVGRVLIPGLMKRYQTEDERELDAASATEIFRRSGFDARTEIYDFGSAPLAGLFPGWRFGFEAARRIDDAVLRIPALRNLGSNFEIIARSPHV